MSCCLHPSVKAEIIELAHSCGLEKVILFGSRARGENRERSDIDLAVIGGDTVKFITSVDDEVSTLLMFDVIDLGKSVQAELMEEIRKDGIVLYEKI